MNPATATRSLGMTLERQLLASEEGQKTILFGSMIGSGRLPDGTSVELVAASSELEIRVDVPNHERRAYRVDLQPLLSLAVEVTQDEIAEVSAATPDTAFGI